MCSHYSFFLLYYSKLFPELQIFGKRMSKYEDKIFQIIIRKYSVQKEKSFADLGNGNLRFDFYIPSNKILIEVQGEQHYKQISRYQKHREDFLQQQERDRKKISYALSHGLTLYCIPYWEIEKISTISDVLNPKFIARDRWKNDKDWLDFQLTSRR